MNDKLKRSSTMLLRFFMSDCRNKDMINQKRRSAMRKRRLLAIIFIIVMVFALMPVLSVQRAKAADDSIYCCQASQQCLMYGEGEDGVHYDTSHSLRYAWRCLSLIHI